MHVLICLDQAAGSLGGAQQSALLQRRALEELGHRVTFFEPGEVAHPEPGTAPIPSRPAAGGYRAALPTRATLRRCLPALDAAGPFDVVHIQADYWGAILGIAYARSRGLPIVTTFHNNMAEGQRAVLGAAEPVAGPAIVKLLQRQLARVAGVRAVPRGASAWSHLARIAAASTAATTVSGHFAFSLAEHGVPGPIEVIPNGVDDAVLDAALAAASERAPWAEPTIVWAGRMSREKRPLEFLEAVAGAREPFRVRMFGLGPIAEQVARRVAQLGLASRVDLLGRVPYPEMLAEIARADALAQTSIGFETQGMTVMEAAVLGTPVILSDARLAGELPAGAAWVPADDSAGALAATLDEAASAIRARRAHPAGAEADGAAAALAAFRERARQSARTREMLAVYERVTRAEAR